MNPVRIAAIGAAVFVVGLGIGRFSLPARVVTKTETVTVEHVHEIKDDHKTDHSTTTTTRVEDRGKVTTTTVTNNDVDSRSSDHTQDDKKTDALNQKTEDRAATWSIGAAMLGKLGTPGVSYGAVLGYRVLGPIWVGGIITTSGGAAATLSVSF